MSFLAEQVAINKLLSNCILEIPRNQRNYVWKKDNWEDLLSDMNFIVDNNEKRKHFIGSIVLKNEDAINGLDRYTIIDGQQRTITIMLFLATIMKLFQEREMQEDFHGTIQYLMSTDRKSIKYCILHSENHLFINNFITTLSNYEQEKNINDLVREATTNKVKERCVSDCVLFFYEELKKECKKKKDPNLYLIAMRDALIDTKCVKITANTEEDSYTIFEILNARGLELEDHELLKNYIMRYIQPKNTVDEVKKRWENIEDLLGKSINRFFKHYATHKRQNNNKEQVYRVLQKAYPKDKVIELMNDIVLKSNYYQIIISPEKDGENKNCSKLEYRIFKFFKEKRAEQFRPILLSLMNKKELGVLSTERYEKALKFLYAFFVCYNIIGEEKSNKLEDVIYKYAPLIEQTYTDQLLDEFIDNIKKKIPVLKTFTERLITLGWSNHNEFYKDSRNKDRVRIILELIEENLSGAVDFENSTLEHVLPDSQSPDNALIGNIILLEKNINENCKNKDIITKLNYYKHSNYKMARDFSERYKENKFDPQSRVKAIARKIYNDILHLQEC